MNDAGRSHADVGVSTTGPVLSRTRANIEVTSLELTASEPDLLATANRLTRERGTVLAGGAPNESTRPEIGRAHRPA